MKQMQTSDKLATFLIIVQALLWVPGSDSK